MKQSSCNELHGSSGSRRAVSSSRPSVIISPRPTTRTLHPSRVWSSNRSASNTTIVWRADWQRSDPGPTRNTMSLSTNRTTRGRSWAGHPRSPRSARPHRAPDAFDSPRKRGRGTRGNSYRDTSGPWTAGARVKGPETRRESQLRRLCAGRVTASAATASASSGEPDVSIVMRLATERSSSPSASRSRSSLSEASVPASARHQALANRGDRCDATEHVHIGRGVGGDRLRLVTPEWIHPGGVEDHRLAQPEEQRARSRSARRSRRSRLVVETLAVSVVARASCGRGRQVLADLVGAQHGPSQLVAEAGRERRLAGARQPAHEREHDPAPRADGRAHAEEQPGLVAARRRRPARRGGTRPSPARGPGTRRSGARASPDRSRPRTRGTTPGSGHRDPARRAVRGPSRGTRHRRARRRSAARRRTRCSRGCEGRRRGRRCRRRAGRRDRRAPCRPRCGLRRAAPRPSRYRRASASTARRDLRIEHRADERAPSSRSSTPSRAHRSTDPVGRDSAEVSARAWNAASARATSRRHASTGSRCCTRVASRRSSGMRRITTRWSQGAAVGTEHVGDAEVHVRREPPVQLDLPAAYLFACTRRSRSRGSRASPAS